MSFGQRVGLIRKTKDLSQKDLGKLLGITGDAVSKYERDIITPSIELAAKMARVLNVSLDFLVEGETPIEDEKDHKISSPLKQFEKLALEDQKHVLAVIEAFLSKIKYKALINVVDKS